MKEAIIKIAYAEDHDAVRHGLISIFNEQKGIRIVADAPNGKQLIEKIKGLKDLPDVALLDVDMPVMNGYETVKMFRKDFPTIKSIAFSMHDDEYNIIKMISNGAVGYLIKGKDNLNIICDALRQVHQIGHYYSDDVTEQQFKKAQQTQLPELSERELEFLQYCCKGLSNKLIAEKMFVSHRTVEHYYESLSVKLNIKSRIGMVAFALKTGLCK